MRLAREGPNELPAESRRSPLRILIEVVREPMFALLIGAGAIYLALGDLYEALILIAFASLSVVISVVQENRSERVLEALRNLASPRAQVIRDGQLRRIPGRDVVRDDLIIVTEGDRVPADAVLLSGDAIQTDESLLTGESMPVRKKIDAPPMLVAPRPGGDDLPYVFSGTLVTRGTGRARVIATGPRSEIGKIGLALHGIELEPPRLRVQTRLLVANFAVVSMTLSALAVVLYGSLRGSWLDALLGGIALGMSMLPEEFPLVLTVFMAMGAWRISRARVLTRKAAAIESLGAATVLCTDKTGTLTLNRMSIVHLECADSIWGATEGGDHVASPGAELVEVGVLASAREPIDPMDRAFHELARQRLSGTDAKFAGRTLVRQYALRPDLPVMTNVWTDGGANLLAVAKGAPEAVAVLCQLGSDATQALRGKVDELAAGGMRVLALARASVADGNLPEAQNGFRFAFVGLAGFADPLRLGVPEAMEQCRSAGVRVVMITGDYPATARAIAEQAGLAANGVTTGDDISAMSGAELRERVRTANVFARILPEQKLLIVNALKDNGEIVAMTGDGVNDAPSLKAAHIGIAMGARGTDVAREAASIVLLDDDFGSIVRTIRLGRRIYDNLRKSMGYILALHIPIAGLALLPLLLGLPIILTPMLIALMEMIIDPSCSVVLEAEPEEHDVMSRRPRDPQEPILTASLVGWSVTQGLLALAVVAVIFLMAAGRDMPEAELRALTFVSLVTTNIALIFVNRSFSASLVEAFRQPNPLLWAGLGAVVCMLAMVLFWPAAAALFRLGRLHADDLAVSLGAALVLLAVLDTIKPFWRRRLHA